MRKLLFLATALIVGLVATGCAAATPPPVSTRQLTVADDGSTVRLARGQSVTVSLAARGLFSWHVPTARDSAVRQVDAGGGYPTDQPARATFVAVARGTATLTATNDTACRHAQPACLPPQQQWRVTLLVG